jgi:hypothetical protein
MRSYRRAHMTEKPARVVGDRNSRIVVNASHSIAFPTHPMYNPRGGKAQRQPFVARPDAYTMRGIGTTGWCGDSQGAHQRGNSVRCRGRGEVILLGQREVHIRSRAHGGPSLQQRQRGRRKGHCGIPVVRPKDPASSSPSGELAPRSPAPTSR